MHVITDQDRCLFAMATNGRVLCGGLVGETARLVNEDNFVCIC